jgi:hypothetical protein
MDHQNLDRREFVRIVGSAGVAAAAGLSRFEILQAAPQANAAPGPDAAERDLALLALDAARSAGANYADVRISRHNFESLSTRERQITGVSKSESYGIGVRALVGGSWGFAATRDVSRDGVVRAAREAASIAAANDRVAPNKIVLAPVPKVPDGRWITPHRVDPFTVPLETKAELLFRTNDEALKVKGVRFVTSSVSSVKGKPARRHIGGLRHSADLHSREPGGHGHRGGGRQFGFADAQRGNGPFGFGLGIRDRTHAARERQPLRERSGDEALGHAGRCRRLGPRAPPVSPLADDSRIDCPPDRARSRARLRSELRGNDLPGSAREGARQVQAWRRPHDLRRQSHRVRWMRYGRLGR